MTGGTIKFSIYGDDKLSTKQTLRLVYDALNEKVITPSIRSLVIFFPKTPPTSPATTMPAP